MSPGDPGSPDRSCQEPVSTVKRHKQFADEGVEKLFIVKIDYKNLIGFLIIKELN